MSSNEMWRTSACTTANGSPNAVGKSIPSFAAARSRLGQTISLAAGLEAPGLFVDRYEKKTPRGGITIAAVPHTAPTTFAEGEFNRYYLRGLCARLIAEGSGQIEIYRARSSAQARTASEAMIGAILDPAALLADLRANMGVDTALGLPPGPNSGLSGRIAQGPRP